MRYTYSIRGTIDLETEDINEVIPMLLEMSPDEILEMSERAYLDTSDVDCEG